MHFNTELLTGTAAPLNGGVAFPASTLSLQADPTNTDDVLIGDGSAQPIRMPPGATLRIDVGDVTQIWAKAASGSPRLNWVAGNEAEIVDVGSGGGGGGGSVTQGTTPWITDSSGFTQPVSALALPLPLGASTELTLAAVLAKLSADPATQTTLAAILAALAGTLSVVTLTGAITDRSGTITAGGVSQQIMAGNSSRKSFFVTNPHATDTLWVRWGASAAAANGAGSIPILPGGALGPDNFVPTAALQGVTATTGDAFTAWEA